jgi:hypothetical protein
LRARGHAQSLLSATNVLRVNAIKHHVTS